jgi:hypothetical protein
MHAENRGKAQEKKRKKNSKDKKAIFFILTQNYM